MRILVIKLGALGDFFHAFHAFAAIRQHHAADRITLLTTPPFEKLACISPWFDAVLVDPRAPWWNLAANWHTAGLIRGFELVYDLQTSSRSNRYFRLAGRPPWSGVAAGCSLPHANPDRDFMHTIERQREQLQHAGIADFPLPDRTWLVGQSKLLDIPDPFALLVPGGGGVGQAKRWPVGRYAEAARHLQADGLAPIIIGASLERSLGKAIQSVCPEAIDLIGKTGFADVASLGARASLVLGNDTGPLQIAASMGAPTLALFSRATEPRQAAPRGPAGEWGTILQEPDLRELSVDRVVAAARLTAGR